MSERIDNTLKDDASLDGFPDSGTGVDDLLQKTVEITSFVKGLAVGGFALGEILGGKGLDRLVDCVEARFGGVENIGGITKQTINAIRRKAVSLKNEGENILAN